MIQPRKQSVYKFYPVFKRIFDFSAALLMLVLLSPLLIIVAVLIKVTDREEIIFKQPRPGKDAKIFTLYKFKTMIKNDRSDDGRPLSDVERTTKLGSFLRRTSIDELPQLINILKGEMSFIGPRPLLVRYLPHYSREQSRRHEVLPGISGWAQVNGRNSSTWEERFTLDIWYVDNLSLFLDIKIIFMTVASVFSGSGVNRNENETMPYFDEQLTHKLQ